MNPYLSEKARGEIPRVLKWLRNAGLAFCVFCSVGGLYTLCLSLQDKDYSHIGGYVFWIVVGAVPLALFARGEARRYHARTIARRVESYSGPEVPLRWLCNSVGMDPKDLAWYCKLFIPCGGADSPRPIKLRRKGDGQWFLWEQYLMTGIRVPASADPWA